MIRLLALAAVLYAPAALACPEGGATASAEHKEGAGCHMPSAEATTAALPADGTHSFLAVSGMSCGSCADKVHAALMGVAGVTGAKVDLTGGKVEVAYDAKKTSLDKLVAAVTATGTFTATVATN